MKASLRWVVEVWSYWRSRLSTRDDRLVACGAWMGRLYTDNSRYYFEWLCAHSNGFEVRWIGTEDQKAKMPERLRDRFLLRGSSAARRYLRKAKWWVCCQSVLDFDDLPLHAGATVLDLWHGIPLKKMGVMRSLAKGRRGLLRVRGIVADVLRPVAKEWTIASGERMAMIMYRSYPKVFAAERILRTGSPRIDWLLSRSKDGAARKEARRRYAKLFGYDPEKKVVLYAPTKRFRKGAEEFAFYAADVRRLEKVRTLLEANGAVLVEKHHPLSINSNPPPAGRDFPFVVTAENQTEVDVQELLLVADVLVTDYSSIYIDFALLGRPCIHYVYDYDEYVSSDSGLAYDMEKVRGGPMERTFDGLLARLGEALASGRGEVGTEFRGLVEYERGDACERLYEWMKSS